MTVAPWLESDDEFEGVGAHPLNPRYDPVDEEEPVHPSTVAPHVQARIQSFVTVAAPRLDGHDGSHHQFDAGPVDLDALSKATWILWWKATQSTAYVDPTFAPVWSRRTRWTHRHAYHWLSSTTDPEQQADHFLKTVEASGGFSPGDNGMGDFEEAGITVDTCLAFMEYVEARRKLPMSPYSGLYVAGGTIWNDDRIRLSKYGPRPMHLAAYVTETRLAQIMADRKAKPFDAWQFSSNGPVPGITGRADMNRVDRKGVYDLACGLAAPTPQTPEDDMALATNAETRTMPYGDAAPGTAVFLVGLQKRNIGAEEYQKVYANAPAAPLSNEALDAIPDINGNGTNTAALTALNDAVGRLGQKIGDVQSGLIKAGGG